MEIKQLTLEQSMDQEMNSGFLEKINKIDKPLARLTNKKFSNT